MHRAAMPRRMQPRPKSRSPSTSISRVSSSRSTAIEQWAPVVCPCTQTNHGSGPSTPAGRQT